MRDGNGSERPQQNKRLQRMLFCSEARKGVDFLPENKYIRAWILRFLPGYSLFLLARLVLSFAGWKRQALAAMAARGIFPEVAGHKHPLWSCLSVQAAQAHRTGSPCTAARTGAGQGTFFPSHKNLPVPQQDEPEPSPSFWSCFLKKQAVCNPAVRVCPSFPINS